MIQFSANLGFLWTDRSLPEAIACAKRAGFAAVECHWPYDTPSEEVAQALRETGLPMLGLNTLRGDVEAGDNGVAALPGREADARRFIEQAVEYATAIDCSNIHVMAGFTDKGAAAREAFIENLTYACDLARQHNKTILIEPLNWYDVPGYHLQTVEEAQTVLREVDAANLKIMFDCYHMQIMGGDLLRRFKAAEQDVGHVQFAAVPDRGEPDSGEVNYSWLLREIAAAGFAKPFGAEYKPRLSTEEGLGWLAKF
ncbi:hydroxypyruvate isomerase family protein [Pseudahrensia aquimaris]|uniref:Hydroxypyruvate isomerase family protein n=1 Tax=Pseudahrensia aquimaris TaxID=744461 RepID=A0ABW3F9U4_9HYPH